MAPHAPYTVSDKSFEQILTLSEQLQIPINTHLHETQDEIRESLTKFGVRPLARLEKLGLLGPSFIAVHAVHLEPAEIALLAQLGCSVAHCPSSNLKLASGIAPVGKMLSSGVNVGLGTDGAASNNRLDVFAKCALPRCSPRQAARMRETASCPHCPAHGNTERRAGAGPRAAISVRLKRASPPTCAR